MLDVIPPTSPSSPSRRAPKRRGRSVPQSRKPKYLGALPDRAADSVVKIEWRLPARLRRPVKQELDRQRRRQRQQRAIIHFERRPIYSELPSQYPKYQGKQGKSDWQGAEQHTGDVYRQGKPAVQMPFPPYRAGKSSTARPNSPAQAPRRKMYPTQSSPATNKPAQKIIANNVRQKRTISNNSRGIPGLGDAVRDVPYQWQKTALEKNLPHDLQLVPTVQSQVEAAVKPPRRRFALPLHFSIFPLSLRPKRNKSGEVKKKISKSRLANVILLLIGCGVSACLIWVLQGAGRGFSVAGALESKAGQAIDHVLAASTALAETNFVTSQEEFATAEKLLQETRQELSAALASSQLVLEYVDVTGTVHASDTLLEIGELLTTAGQHVAAGMGPLLEANVLNVEAKDDATFAAALNNTFTEFSAANQALIRAEELLQSINTVLLPEALAAPVQELNATLPRVRAALAGFLDQNTALLHVIGADHARQYLVLFQNNHELRPTGGFIGSIGLINVDRGVVEDINIKSVYDPDGQLKERIAPPTQLLPITDRWYLRDANWFVDFEVSAQKIASFFEKESGPTVDGVIALTPEVIKELLRVTGPIEVPGFDVTVNADNFTLLTQDQVTYAYDREENKPKQFLADLTPILLNKVFSTRGDHTLKVVGALQKMIQEKQLLIYFKDADVQSQIHKLGWSGSFPQDAQGFLSINNANIGGHKSDQFVEQEIDYRSEVMPNLDVEVNVTVRRTHRGPSEALDYNYPDNEDPAYKNNVVYQRMLVPRGALLQEARGFTPAVDVPKVVIPSDLEVEPDDSLVEWQRSQTTDPSGTTIGLEAGYAFFGNWIITKPGETTVTFYRYRLPHHAALPTLLDRAQRYSMYIAKQPGDTRTALRAELRVPANFKVVHTVPEDGITPTDARTLVYRGNLSRDTLVGAVVEKE